MLFVLAVVVVCVFAYVCITAILIACIGVI